jgi:hypothetical protein
MPTARSRRTTERRSTLTPEAGTADTAADIVALLVDDAASP